jgi:hypothetical protein
LQKAIDVRVRQALERAAVEGSAVLRSFAARNPTGPRLVLQNG